MADDRKPRSPNSGRPSGGGGLKGKSSGKPGGGGGYKGKRPDSDGRGEGHGGGKPFRGKPGGGYKGKRDDGRKSGERKPYKPRETLTNAQAARKAAAMAVADVLGRGFRLESSLAKNPALDGLAPRDRAFSRAIAATTLRRLGQIDAVIEPLVKRPPPGRVRAYIQTAAAQMIFMDVAPHAAVGDTVTLIKSDSKSEPFSGLANAVLRRIADTGKAEAAKTAPIRNVPGWLRSDWTRSFGKAEVRRMALLLTQSPPLDISVKSDPDGWAEKLGGEVIGERTVRLDSIGNVTALEGFQDGQWWAQDIAASLPARVLEQLCGGLEGKRVADLCAAPGGKTLQLLSMGAQVTAVDVSEARTAKLHQNLERTRMSAEVVTSDLADYAPDTLFDAVLLDAPCSATGTFRRHPDVVHNRREKDITPLTRLQDTLLQRAASLVAPGGVLLYSVCSLQEREGLPRVERVNKRLPDFRLIPVPSPDGLSLPEARLSGGALRILPPDAPDGRGMDGFFIAALRRNGEDAQERKENASL